MIDNQIPENEINLDRKGYKIRCIDCILGKSKKGNPMLIQTFEIIDEPPYEQDGVELDINGVKVMNWSVLTEEAIGPLNSQRAALGLSKVTKNELSTINPLDYKGLEGYAYIESQKSEMINDRTGKPVINPLTGEPEVNWSKKIVRYPSAKK